MAKTTSAAQSSTVAASVANDVTTTSKSFAERVDERRRDVQLTIKLQRTYEFAVSPKRKPVLFDEKPIVEHSWTTLSSNQTGDWVAPFPLTANGRLTCDLPLGVTAIYGKSGSGKTRLAFHHLFAAIDATNRGSARYLKAFEPGNDAAMMAVSPAVDVPMFEVDLAVALADALVDPKVDVIIVDSLRYLFYSSSGGATGKGGVNMALFMDLTHLDLVASSLGKRVVVVINPMTDDDTAFNFYVEAALGAVAGVVVMDDYRNARFSNRYAQVRDFQHVKLPAVAVHERSPTGNAPPPVLTSSAVAPSNTFRPMFGKP